MNKIAKDREEKWKIVEEELLRQRQTINHHLLVQNNKKMATQVQLVMARVVAMITELSTGLRPPEKDQIGRLLEMTTIGTKIAVKDTRLLMNGDILLPMSEGEEVRGGEEIMREEVDCLPPQIDKKGVELRIVSANENEAVEKKELVTEKERHLVSMMMVMVR